MKAMAFFLAMTGGGYRRENNNLTALNRANIMIINDKSKKGNIRVITIGDIFNEILSSNSLSSVNVENLDSNTVWDNTWLDAEEGNSETKSP